MAAKPSIGFIGLGVMGEPMCRHLVQKSGLPVVVHDINAEPVARLEALGARNGGSIAEVAKADVIFISLPSGAHLQIFDPVRHAGQIGMDRNRHHARRFRAIDVKPVEMIAAAAENLV